ncbi:MAG: hypothetical protein WCF24_12425 [Acidimicrobiales bacterium]
MRRTPSGVDREVARSFESRRRLDEFIAELEHLSTLEIARNEHWPAPTAPTADRTTVAALSEA